MPKTLLTPELVLAEALKRFEAWIAYPPFVSANDWISLWLMSGLCWAPTESDISEDIELNIYLRQSDRRCVPDGLQSLRMLEIGNFIAADADFGRQFLQQFVQEAHQRHPWDATFVSDFDVVQQMGDMSEWITLNKSDSNNDLHSRYYYLLK